MSTRHPILEMEPVYGFCHACIRWLYGTAFRGEVVGLENLPNRGGYIVAANHASHLDPPIVGLHLSHQVSFFARKTLWKPGFASWWLDAVGTIPVDRDGAADVGAIKRVLATLKSRKSIILFPEGTRSPDGTVQPPKAGVGMIACKTHSPVIPARVFGSFEAFGRGRSIRLGSSVDVVYGPPLVPAQFDRPEDGRERYQRAAQRIMDAISRLESPVRPVI
ncbi:MAG TPA: lysophospholipid acyltransferase family protein [Opitutaceae bacterium]|jgi:1-acyl-sn-glycerol-3-phosphate acyltransferase